MDAVGAMDAVDAVDPMGAVDAMDAVNPMGAVGTHGSRASGAAVERQRAARWALTSFSIRRPRARTRRPCMVAESRPSTQEGALEPSHPCNGLRSPRVVDAMDAMDALDAAAMDALWMP